ncbi:SdpI family protein [Cohnella sp.]|uniref:SdpI family protein n=1 Tax=Cohnella sp. TaxID=1883426 RepID=UPI00356A27D3
MTNEKSKDTLTWSGKDWFLLSVNAILFIVMFVVFNDRLPNEVGSHYNIRGEQDGSMSKTSFWLMNGAICVALPGLLSFMRYIDPRRNNYSRFEGYYDLMRWSISLFLQATFLIVILVNLGYDIPVLHLVLGGLGLLWMVIGNRMGQLRSNYFVGIKTPWALSDETNWKLTHRLSGRLWFVAGLIMLVCAWFVSVEWFLPVLLICVLSSSLIPVAYSYILYTRKSKA